MTPKELIELATDSYLLHHWVVPSTFIGVVIGALFFIVLGALLCVRESKRLDQEKQHTQSKRAELDAISRRMSR